MWLQFVKGSENGCPSPPHPDEICIEQASSRTANVLGSFRAYCINIYFHIRILKLERVCVLYTYRQVYIYVYQYMYVYIYIYVYISRYLSHSDWSDSCLFVCLLAKPPHHFLFDSESESFFPFFLPGVMKTQLNHWTMWVVSTRFITEK